MAKSRETFNKKEKEKKKRKKKLDKLEKKEARKANKGADFEEMLAYVDENGNISSTPPDPAKKKKIDHEKIEISVSRQDDTEVSDLPREGKVTFFNESKGYGFIRDRETNESIFVHIKEMVDLINENEKVSFEVEMTPRGPNACNVRLLK